MPVTAPRRSLPRALEAIIEEARRRARKRRRTSAIGAGLALALVTAGVVLFAGGSGDDPDRAPTKPAAAAPERLALAEAPYMGVSCPEPNEIGCDRVGLAVWLRRPVERLSATIAGRPLALRMPCGTAEYMISCRRYCREVTLPCGTYFEGFLQPAGLRDGALEVRPEGRKRWLGRGAPVVVVRIAGVYRDGRTATRAVRVRLSTGWG